MKKFRTIGLGALLAIGLVGVLLAQTTRVSPVTTITCTNQFLSALSAAGVFTCSSIGTNQVTNAMLAQASANTMKGNWTGSTANEADNAMPSCPDTGGNHLNYVDGTGITCGTEAPTGTAQSWTAEQTFAAVKGTARTVSGTTDTILSSDCGKTIVFTSGSAITLTTLASIVSGTETCSIAVNQAGAGQVTVSNGGGATQVSYSGCTKTAGQYATLSLFIQPNSASQYQIGGECSP